MNANVKKIPFIVAYAKIIWFGEIRNGYEHKFEQPKEG